MTAISPKDGPVAVTGASGNFGGHMVRELMLHGYQVRALIRDGSSWRGQDATAYLSQLPGVEVIDGCDLFVPGSFDAAFDGCCSVFHTAAVLGNSAGDQPLGTGDLAQDVYNGGKSGTQYVIDAVNASGTVNRVIYTSSDRAMVSGPKGDRVPDGYEWTETDWSDDEVDPEEWQAPKNAYARGKVDAERMLNTAADASGGGWDVGRRHAEVYLDADGAGLGHGVRGGAERHDGGQPHLRRADAAVERCDVDVLTDSGRRDEHIDGGHGGRHGDCLMPGPTRQVHAVDLSYPPRMSQSTRSRPDAEAGQSRSAAQRDGALDPGPPVGLVPKDHIPKRRRRGSGGVRVLAAVACLAWLAWPTEAFAYTLTISPITFNDILDASEYSNGFDITGNTGTEQGIAVEVTLGTNTWQTTSNTQESGVWWWSVTVGTNATYITHGENEVNAEATFPNNVELDHDRSFYAYLYAPPQINGDTQIQWAENTAENVEVGSHPVVYDDVSLLGFDVSGADEDDFSVLQTYAADGSMSLSVVFEDSPDYEDPDDANANNEYKFTLELVEAGQTLVSKNVTVTVTDEPAVSGSTAVQYAENGTGTVGDLHDQRNRYVDLGGS